MKESSIRSKSSEIGKIAQDRQRLVAKPTRPTERPLMSGHDG